MKIKNKEEIEKHLIENHVDDHNWTNGLYYAMEDYAQQQIKLLNLDIVTQRSELLFDFIQKYNREQISWDNIIDGEVVRLYLKGKL